VQPNLGLVQAKLGLAQPNLGLAQAKLGLAQPNLGLVQAKLGLTQPNFGCNCSVQENLLSLIIWALGIIFRLIQPVNETT
jgi:hypothetical protein